MLYKEHFKKAIESVGCEVLLMAEDGEIPFKASIQPVFSSGREAFSQSSRIGSGARETYKIYIPCDAAIPEIREGDTVKCHGRVYLVEKVEDMCVAGEVYFREGVLVLRKSGTDGEEGYF